MLMRLCVSVPNRFVNCSQLGNFLWRNCFKWVPKVPAGPFNRLNSYFTRRGARDLDKTGLAAKYDEAHASAVAVLETMEDEEWAYSVEYPDWDPMLSGQVTLERLFHYIRLHFDTHAEEIRTVLNSEQ